MCISIVHKNPKENACTQAKLQNLRVLCVFFFFLVRKVRINNRKSFSTIVVVVVVAVPRSKLKLARFIFPRVPYSLSLSLADPSRAARKTKLVT